MKSKNIEDFWRIQQYLYKSLKDYNWYIRHHALVFIKTVLYGIPRENE